MKFSTSPIVLATALALAACQTPSLPPRLPQSLQVTAQETWIGTLSARGVQIYECRSRAGQPGWDLVAPDADLFRNGGQPFGHHGAGPSWQAEDGSLVVGNVLARADAPVAGAIPWLLLEARSNSGKGALAGVARIRRVNTTGGVAPVAGCDAQSRGQQVRVPYTADYVLYAVYPARSDRAVDAVAVQASV